MIEVDAHRCTGCRACEVACAFFHSGKTSRPMSRIKVTHIYETGVDAPVVCAQCKERYCLTCPDKALAIGTKGEVVVSMSHCSSCGKCEASCPIGAIELAGEITYVCDLCGGDPRCVPACTAGALTYLPEVSGACTLKELRTLTRGSNPSRKRLVRAQSLGGPVREAWMKRNG